MQQNIHDSIAVNFMYTLGTLTRASPDCGVVNFMNTLGTLLRASPDCGIVKCLSLHPYTHVYTSVDANATRTDSGKKSKVHGCGLRGHAAGLQEPGFLCALQDLWARADKSS